MPESCRETQTEGGRPQRQNTPAHNVVSTLSQLADDHLTLVRNISTGLALAGVIVIARSIKLITKFQAVSEIPARFVERNVSLRGRVHSITEEGLEVEHIPIYLPVLSPLLTKHKADERRSHLHHIHKNGRATVRSDTTKEKSNTEQFERCVQVKLARGPCRCGSDSRWPIMAAGKPSFLSNSLVETHQPPGRQAALLCHLKQGVVMGPLDERGGAQTRPGPQGAHSGTLTGLSPLLAAAQAASQGRGQS
ncbi:protein C3orf33 homolog isoform X4 [Dunckerocampus dactyliophorus]|uniref:protein C3orf33 homolog isoform X4 n=1 Tax=Dunckerocampus dactyliophorus TaxID=161453 RepID=UPI002404EB9E|nr:protein C3orf33 homolog isoform X4 [Dunckerocampus dactyliophorus]